MYYPLHLIVKLHPGDPGYGAALKDAKEAAQERVQSRIEAAVHDAEKHAEQKGQEAARAEVLSAEAKTRLFLFLYGSSV